MPERSEQDYVLGTNEEELQRLGLQHSVWRDAALDCWRRAGITAGSRVLDVGAGPGFAAVDLAELVGAHGEVVAVERSERFVRAGRAACAKRGFGNIRFHELDLMNDPLPAGVFDAAWVRWVASFVPSPAALVAKLAAAVRPGGVALFHEYVAYSTWRLAPRRQRVEEFVARVMESWRAAGGEPDVALELPSLLAQVGFRITSAAPLVHCVRPADHTWRWPSSFIEINLKRLIELGYADEQWAASVRREFAAAQSAPDTLMLTPMVLEIIARRESDDAPGDGRRAAAD
jgi:SAM-dependent methyltransferase